MATTVDRAASSVARAGVLAAVLVATAAHGQGPVRGGALPGPLPLFPGDNWWNLDVSSAPVDPGSDSFIQFIGPTRGMHPDFGGDSSPSPEIYGMVYVTVPGTQALEPMTFDYASESDFGAPGRPPGYPIPPEAKTQSKWIEGGYPGNATVGGDKHMLVVDRDNRLLFETWNTRCLPAGSPSCSWRAGSGAVFPLDSSVRRPEGWTSADAAGLAILPGLVRYDEVFGTEPIRHALRVTVRSTNGHVYPASHTAGSTTGAPPMGMRLRLKADRDISGFPAEVQRIFQAMKTYGLIVADNGSDLYVQGTYDTRWNNSVLNPAFASIRATDFEVVELGWRGPRLHSISPCRLLDTRGPAGPFGGPALAAGATRSFAVADGGCGLPADATGLSLNVTAADATSAGHLTLYPGTGAATPTTTVEFQPGKNRAVGLVIGVGQGAVSVASAQATGSVHMIVDVGGYFR